MPNFLLRPYESGNGKRIINGNEYNVMEGEGIVVPAGAKHNVVNTGSAGELKMHTIYAPPHHKDGIVRSSKTEAEDFTKKLTGRKQNSILLMKTN